MSAKTYPKLLSICIPTYNRGHRALRLVRSLLAAEIISGRDDIEIIVSDNGSMVHTEEYEIIREIDDTRLEYVRNEENLQFYGNFNSIIKLSKGHYCMLISDEDDINLSQFAEFMGFLENVPNVGMIKIGTSGQYNDMSMGIHKAGEEALKRFYLTGNYISGTVYNRDYVTNELIDELKKMYEGDEGYFYYPHLFVEGLILNAADFYSYCNIVIKEGSDEGDIPHSDDASIPLFAMWESRLHQMEGYLKLVKDLRTDDGIKQLMFMMAVCKTISLIALVKKKYIEAGHEWNKVYESAGNAILDSVRKCDIEVIKNNMDAYLEVVADFIREDMK